MSLGAILSEFGSLGPSCDHLGISKVKACIQMGPHGDQKITPRAYKCQYEPPNDFVYNLRVFFFRTLLGLLGLACCLGLPGLPCASFVLLELGLKLGLVLSFSCLALPYLAVSLLLSWLVLSFLVLSRSR